MIVDEMDIAIDLADDGHLYIILPCKMDDFTVTWQQAQVIGTTLEKAAEYIPIKTIDPIQDEVLSQQLRLRRHRTTHVVFAFDHTDRIKLSYEATRIVARSIRLIAQDLELLARGFHILYNQPGRIGRPTPFWDADRMKKTFRTR